MEELLLQHLSETLSSFCHGGVSLSPKSHLFVVLCLILLSVVLLRKINSKVRETTSIHVTALDAIVSVNSLFTAIVFLGISFNMTAIGDTSPCASGPEIIKQLVIFEVVSFSCFLFSSLLAQGLKLHVNILNCYNQNDADQAMIDKSLLTYGLVASALGSGGGCIFLMVAMINVIRVRLGKISCSEYSLPTVIILIVLVSSGILMFLYAIYDATMREKREKRKEEARAELTAAAEMHHQP